MASTKVHVISSILFAYGIVNVTGTLSPVPDDTVYTDVNRIAREGTTVVLPCRFQGDPIEVNWKKGQDVNYSVDLVFWTEAHIPLDKVPCIAVQTSCFIDRNFSLVIDNVRATDAGRYFCRVDNHHGLLIQNHSDVVVESSTGYITTSTFPFKSSTEVSATSPTIRVEVGNNKMKIALPVVAGFVIIAFIIAFTLHRRQQPPNDYKNVTTADDCTLRKDEPLSDLKAMVDLYSNKAIERHCRRLEDAIVARKCLIKREMNKIIKENHDALFDTPKMLQDWWEEQNGDTMDTKKRLETALEKIQRPGGSDWIYDDELQQVVECMTPQIANKLYKSLGIASKQEFTQENAIALLRQWRDDNADRDSPKKARITLHDALEEINFSVTVLTDKELADVCKHVSDKQKGRELMTKLEIDASGRDCSLFDALLSWREWEGDMADCWERRKKLLAALEKINIKGDLMHIRGDLIYKVELYDLAYMLILQDIRPLAQALDIAEDRLASYRRTFKREHNGKGTFFLVTKLHDITKTPSSEGRAPFCIELRKIGFIHSSREGVLGICRNSESSRKENIREMVKNMDRDTKGRIQGLLNLESGTVDSCAELCNQIEHWIEGRMKTLEKVIDTTAFKSTWKKHRNFNDTLLENGFYELAYEVMILEEKIASNDPNSSFA